MLVVGAGIVGAACAYYAARSGLSVTVIDRAGVAGGTTGAGEGNILVSDKQPGPELSLALLSHRLWRDLDIGDIELESKGSLVVAATPAELDGLTRLRAAQRDAGVNAIEVADLREVEPHLSPEMAAGVLYPQDMQVQPMLAAATLLKASGATVHLKTVVRRIEPGRVITDQGTMHAAAVVNASGVWAGPLCSLPVQPRRGFILVTARVGRLVRHKVYAAGYVADVASGSAALHISPVVEGTQAGTILIGSSRERVGFDSTLSLPVLRRLAAAAVELFPVLANVSVIRAYHGFRPWTPDQLPIIGADPVMPGVFHACGHEGAGVGLAPATGHAIACLIAGRDPGLDLAPFHPGRF